MMKNNQKNYELVAWTKMVRNGKGQELRLCDELFEMEDIRYRREIERIVSDDSSSVVDISKGYERYAKFLLEMGYYRRGLEKLSISARYCLLSGEWDTIDSDLGSQNFFYGRSGGRFIYLYKEFHRLVKEYGFEEFLQTEEVQRLEEEYDRFTEWDRVFRQHLYDVKPWRK